VSVKIEKRQSLRTNTSKFIQMKTGKQLFFSESILAKVVKDCLFYLCRQNEKKKWQEKS